MIFTPSTTTTIKLRFIFFFFFHFSVGANRLWLCLCSLCCLFIYYFLYMCHSQLSWLCDGIGVYYWRENEWRLLIGMYKFSSMRFLRLTFLLAIFNNQHNGRTGTCFWVFSYAFRFINPITYLLLFLFL